MAAALTRVSRDPGGIVTFAIFLTGAFVAACITGFAFGRVGAAIWHVLTPIEAMWLGATGVLSSEIAGLCALACRADRKSDHLVVLT